MLSLFYNFIQFGLIMYICYLCLRTDWLVCESLFHFQFYYHFRSVCMMQRHITWPTSVCQRRLPTVITSLALQFLGPSWCPGLGRLLASAALQCMARGPGTDYRRPSNHQNCYSLTLLSQAPAQDPLVPALDSAGCSCGCCVPSSGAVVTVQ